LVRTSAYREAGNFDPHLNNLYEDYDMRIRLSKKYPAIYCDRVLSEYRLLSRGLSSVNKSKHLLALEYIYDKNKGLLDDLPAPERRSVRKKYMKLLSLVSLQASKEAIISNEYGKAVNYAADTVYYMSRNKLI
jgi:hypothetical protein